MHDYKLDYDTNSKIFTLYNGDVMIDEDSDLDKLTERNHEVIANIKKTPEE